MNKQYHIRNQRIKEVLDTIRIIKSKNMKIDKKKFVFEIAERYGCTERKAKEYLKIAELKLEYAEQELSKGT
tara:strand:+ start:372 stop:587 length:216 start_codon:yes stop_codon:yes gene_type:complete